jgi:hypothetical protein
MRFIFFFLYSYLLLAQTKSEFIYEFGNFSNASSFTISSNGIIYITDINKNEILSFDTLGNKLKDIGGFGWQNGLFDKPVDIFANPLSVYVADKNNHRIQQFDRFLNFIASFSNRNQDNFEFSFGFPISVAISNQGDMFILDGENLRVLKFDLFGNFINNFAGVDAGKFKLKKPSAMAINSEGLLFIADNKTLLIFDSFGNGLNKIELNNSIKSLRVIFDNHIITTNNSILKLTFQEDKFIANQIKVSSIKFADVNSALIFNNKLYVLFYNKIKVYKLE